MAVTSVIIDWKSLTGGGSVQVEGGVSGKRTVKFDVTFDDSDAPLARPSLAMVASHGGTSVPAYFAAHPIDGDFYVMNKTVNAGNGPMNWEVTVDYEYHENPMLQPYTVQFFPQFTQEAIDKCIAKLATPQTALSTATDLTVPLENSAGEPIDPPIQEEFNDLLIVVKRNEAAFDLNVAKPYFSAVNSDIFTLLMRRGSFAYDGKWGQFIFTRNSVNFPIGTVRCKSIQAEEKQYGLTFYHEVTYEFISRDTGWLRRALDQGFRILVAGEPLNVTDSEGNPITQPIKLDGSGGPLNNGTPVFLNFQTKRAKPFAVFNFK